MNFAEVVEKKRVVGDGFFDELLDDDDFRAVDDRVDAVLICLHRRKCLEGTSQQNDCGMTPLSHRHFFQGIERGILLDFGRIKKVFDDDDLIADLAEARGEIVVRGDGVNFIAKFLQGVFGRFSPSRIGTNDQRRLVGGVDEIKFIGHGVPALFKFERRGGRRFAGVRAFAHL